MWLISELVGLVLKNWKSYCLIIFFFYEEEKQTKKKQIETTGSQNSLNSYGHCCTLYVLKHVVAIMFAHRTCIYTTT